MSPTARSLQELRKRGAIAQVVERWNPGARRRVDLFGVIDIVALEVGQPGCLGIQACSGSGGDHAQRRRKILDEPRALLWLTAGNRLAVWSWAKQGPRGKRKRWVMRETVMGPNDWPIKEAAS